MLITLTEYAAKNGVSPSTVRHKISNGNLPAQKIGRDWFIEDDTPWVDNRFKKKCTQKLPNVETIEHFALEKEQALQKKIKEVDLLLKGKEEYIMLVKENHECSKCAHFLFSYETQKMECIKGLSYSNSCYTTNHQNYINLSTCVSVNKKVTLYIGNAKKEAIIKEVRYREEDGCKFNFKYCIEIENEALLYSVSADMQGNLYLTSHENNDIHGNEIKIKITNYQKLIDLLYEISDFKDSSILECRTSYYKRNFCD